MRVTAGQAHPETGREDGTRWATEGLQRLVDRTPKTGVRLVYENHGKPGAWTYTDFSQPPRRALLTLPSGALTDLRRDRVGMPIWRAFAAGFAAAARRFSPARPL